MRNETTSGTDRDGRARASTSATPIGTATLHDVADLLALGYVRYRARQAALEARASRVASAQNPLDDVPPRATFATGERRTSETGGDA